MSWGRKGGTEGNWGRQAPDGHPRRCQAKLRRKFGAQCGRWALVDSKYCHFHGGRKSALRGGILGKLPMFYAKDLNTTIAQAVEEHLQTDPSEQLALFEELALMRHTAGSALKMYSAAMTTTDLSVQQSASELVRMVLHEVARMCEAAARVQASGKDRFSIHNLAYVVARITKIAYQVFGDDEEGMQKARQFEELIRNEVKLAREVEGTSITPDEDVLAMDDTVPKV